MEKMINTDNVLEEMRETFNQVAPDTTYPETAVQLASWISRVEDDGIDEEDLETLRDDLMRADPTLQMHPAVAELVEGICNYEIAQGDGEAANSLGALYYDGRIGEQDFVKAAEMYEIAAKLGSAWAQENLGYIWYYGRTGVKDYAKAFHCFIKGALADRPISMYKIGDMYKNGYYVAKDPKMAFTVYMNSQRLMDDEENVFSAGADISMRLADCFFEGFGVEQDYEQALMFYQQAERLYYRKIAAGDHLFRGSLKHVIINEQICRQKMVEDMPDFDWVKEK